MIKLKTAFIVLLTLAVTMAMAQRPSRIVVYKFFDGQYRKGGFDYVYPSTSSIITDKDKANEYKSQQSLKINLDQNDYSGASVCLYNETFDLSKVLLDGAVEFYIKGNVGGEQAIFGLLDSDGKGKKTQSKLPIGRYVDKTKEISKDWQLVRIPLADFPDRGLYWDDTKKAEVADRINWNKIAEFRISIDKGTNPKGFQVWVNSVEIVKGTVSVSKPKAKVVYWDENPDPMDGPKEPAKLDGKAKALPNGVFYSDNFTGFGYVYGGLTAWKEQASKTAGNPNVLSFYMDDNDYSGATLSLGEGKFIDLSKVRDKGGVYFWVKGKQGGEKVGFGILDNQGGDIKSQTKTNLQDWVEGQTITKEWKLVKIPLKRLPDAGKAWDATKQAEVTKNVQWNKIQEVRFSVGKADNKRDGRPNDPVTIYVDQITFTENIDWVDPDLKWNTFNSKEPALVLHDFENNPVFEPSIGPKSKVSFKIEKSKLDGKSLNITYMLGDWVDVVYDFEKQKAKKEHMDWTKHWGIMFDVYTDKAWQGITVQVGDKGREIFVSSVGAPKGRSTVLVPFRTFTKFPYYQPPEAVQNGVFDLDGVKVLDFKPSGEGSEGYFEIDNVRLTNDREVPRPKVPEIADLTITGDFGKVINPNISKAVFGINAALWDGDLLKPETKTAVKRINHGIVRYPGGLRADDDHWEPILANKDWMVDTDEFLDWCKETGTSPMFTANFGTGTAEEAAKWVEHTNKKKKANVIYWEIGNELYGDWHPQYAKYGADKGHAYGKRAKEFITAMKKVDPSIKVGVLGVLDGEWNENVLKYTADVADALIIHHYPQHFGEENDFGLLASPQDLEKIFNRVKETVKKHSKKELEIWLTEWNSVDFNPGKQSISLINGLFVADYLGTLAKVGAGSAQYWDIHNDVTPEGGDYGYLSRSYDDQIGGNKPRPSYYAFQMASDGIRGKLVESKSGNDDLTTYLAQNGNKKTMLVINKNPYTAFKGTLKIPGFAGKAKVEVLAAPKGQAANKVFKIDPPKASNQDIKEGSAVTFPAHSITLITIDK